MLEEYFIKPSTIDRLRSSWIAPEIEAYVVWLANEGFSTKCVWRRVPIVFAFGEFGRSRGAETIADLSAHVEAFVAEREHETAAPPITPSSPSATDSGCEPGKRAAFGSATSTSIVSCSLCVAANLERAVSFHTARSSATFSHARSSAAAGAPMTRCSASTADEVSIRVARARSSTGSS
jgi:hypothetical protein